MNYPKIDIEDCDLEIVKNILYKHLPKNAQVYVFGSRVKGNAKKFSDLDLAVDNNGAKLEVRILAELNFDFEESDLPYRIDVVDLNAISQSFQHIIKTQAQLLK